MGGMSLPLVDRGLEYNSRMEGLCSAIQENAVPTLSPFSIIREKNLGVTVCSWVSSLLRLAVFWDMQRFSIALFQ